MFSAGMVLQREAALAVVGRGDPGVELEFSFASDAKPVTVGEDGTWRVTLPAMKAGGPFTMEISDGDTSVSLGDVMLGDVWIFSGQSNMQMGLDEVEGGDEVLAEASADAGIRLLSMPKAGAPEPSADPGAEWRRCSPETLRKFSAVAAFFASELRKDPSLEDVPIGLVDSSFGGTAIEAWIPGGVPPGVPEERVSGSMFGISPGHLYNRMIAPLTALPVKGVAWYQGEANAGKPDVYATLLRSMIGRWRERWKQAELPFMVVQLPAFEGRMGSLDFSWLREAQAQSCEATEKAWLAVTYDTTDGYDLHPREKREIGSRLALIARKEVYGADVAAHGPLMEKVAVGGDAITVTFDKSVRPTGDEVAGFSLAGSDGEYRYARASVAGREVVLRADGIGSPESVRYAWGGLTDANLVGESGLPVAPFRTDAFPPESAVFQALPTFHRIETSAYRLETGNGCVASLVVGGRQFLSNEPGGGTRVPGGFGFRNLAHTTVVGPRRLTLADGEVALEIACSDTSMEWTVRNGSGAEIDFHVALSPLVDIRLDGTTAELSRDGVGLKVEGVGRVADDRMLVKRIATRESAVIRFVVASP